MSKMNNMKIKYDSLETSNTGYYPTLTIDDKAISELKNKKVGGRCMILVKGEITGINSDNKSTKYTLEVKEGKYYNEESEGEYAS